MTNAARLALLLLPLAGAMAASPAAAVQAPVTTFYFSGTCTDCEGTVRGELLLSNYVLGDGINASNFLSFHYVGSNLVPGGFTISSSGGRANGAVENPVPGAQSFFAYDNNYFFYSYRDGGWGLGPVNELVADFGTNGTYGLVAPATTVPEPVSLSILGLGLGGTVLLRRRRA